MRRISVGRWCALVEGMARRSKITKVWGENILEQGEARRGNRHGLTEIKKVRRRRRFVDLQTRDVGAERIPRFDILQGGLSVRLGIFPNTVQVQPLAVIASRSEFIASDFPTFARQTAVFRPRAMGSTVSISSDGEGSHSWLFGNENPKKEREERGKKGPRCSLVRPGGLSVSPLNPKSMQPRVPPPCIYACNSIVQAPPLKPRLLLYPVQHTNFYNVCIIQSCHTASRHR